MSAVEPVSTASAPERILRVNNIEVIYDHVILVLKGVSLDVPKGGIVALLGANGAGKTTTLKAVSNLLNSASQSPHSHASFRPSCTLLFGSSVWRMWPLPERPRSQR